MTSRPHAGASAEPSSTAEQMPLFPAGRIDELPLFPLGTVLFPDGVLPLRVFEARYMDMVRDCLREGCSFGVCLITEGHDVGQPAEFEPIGCSARITAWDMEQLGLLNIRAVGRQRFAVESRRIEKDGLVVATVNWLGADDEVDVPDDHRGCVQLLRRIVSDLVDKETEPMRRMIEPPYRFESACWVSNRLCEFLPVSAATKQKLMTLDDPLARLSIVSDYLHRQQVI